MSGTWIVVSAVLSLAAAAGCGPQPKGPVTSADAPDDPGGTLAGGTGGPVTAENICARITALRNASCALVESYTLTEEECRDDYQRSLEDRGKEARTATETAGHCLIDNDTCESITTCWQNMNKYADEQDGTPSQLRTCEDTEQYAPVGLSGDEWSKRHGAGAKRYADVETSKAEPIEVCGIPAQMEWLTGVTCNDGSQPFASYDHAHAARVGNVGAGGRCGSIVDLYEVPCPEGTYKVFIDAYVCPMPE